MVKKRKTFWQDFKLMLLCLISLVLGGAMLFIVAEIVLVVSIGVLVLLLLILPFLAIRRKG